MNTGWLTIHTITISHQKEATNCMVNKIPLRVYTTAKAQQLQYSL